MSTSTVVVTCAQCGEEHEPSKQDILRGQWRECSECRTATPPPIERQPEPGRCAECGRSLKGTQRTICLSCMLGGPVL